MVFGSDPDIVWLKEGDEKIGSKYVKSRVLGKYVGMRREDLKRKVVTAYYILESVKVDPHSRIKKV